MTGSEIAESAKNAGVVLTALSGVTYASGYLVMRARARALGTDPGFVLIDQAYVFAGFRFALTLLLGLLVVAPVLLLLGWVGRLASLLPKGHFSVLEIATALSAGAATIWAYTATIGVSGVLLAPSHGRLADAVLGRNNYGVLMVLATTAIGAAMLLWFYAHFARAGSLDPLGAVLLLISVLLLALLPMQHGIFHADRMARRLDRMPEGVTGLAPPIWLVDRGTSDRVVLCGHTMDGQARLVTLKAEKLDGIAITGVSSLGAALLERTP
jgi:hypothetical protein